MLPQFCFLESNLSMIVFLFASPVPTESNCLSLVSAQWMLMDLAMEELTI